MFVYIKQLTFQLNPLSQSMMDIDQHVNTVRNCSASWLPEGWCAFHVCLGRFISHTFLL